MAKLWQHQMDETYYTRRNIGGFVTHQIHPDGVAYLKYCDVRVGDEIPSSCMTQLQEYGWLFTKDEVPFWGEVDWSPRWVTIQPRSLRDLTPFYAGRSVDDWLNDGLPGTPRSVADSLEAQIESIRNRKAREREQRLAEIRAETEARLAQLRKEGQAKIEAARRSREQELAAKQERQLAEKRREAARKAAETRGRNAVTRAAESAAAPAGTMVNGSLQVSEETPSPSPVVIGLANRIGPLGAPLQRSGVVPDSVPDSIEDRGWVQAMSADTPRNLLEEPYRQRLLDTDEPSVTDTAALSSVYLSRWWTILGLLVFVVIVIALWMWI